MILRIMRRELRAREIVRLPRQMRPRNELHLVVSLRHLLQRDPEAHHGDTVRFRSIDVLSADGEVGIVAVVRGVAAVSARSAEGAHTLGGLGDADRLAVQQLRGVRGQRGEPCLQQQAGEQSGERTARAERRWERADATRRECRAEPVLDHAGAAAHAPCSGRTARSSGA